eukprot:1195363-Prorocentrum_minimum.AAC.2
MGLCVCSVPGVVVYSPREMGLCVCSVPGVIVYSPREMGLCVCSVPGVVEDPLKMKQCYNISSLVYGSSCASNGKGAHNTPETHPIYED